MILTKLTQECKINREKKFFKDVKKVKLERFQCFLYGRLISLLLTSSIVSTGKKILWVESKKEISPMKSFGIVKEFRGKIFQGEIVLIRFLSKIIESIMKYGVKSKKKGKKTSFEIIESVKISKDELESLVV